MTQRRILEQRLAGLEEIGGILDSMKNLAFIETRKLDRLTANQRETVRRIGTVAADFLAFHQEVLPVGEPTHRVYLVIGSRRGFCGDFNERLQAVLQRELGGGNAGGGVPTVIAVGHKLCVRLRDAPGLAAIVEGADVVEEIPSVLRAVVTELDARQAACGPLTLRVIYRSLTATEPCVEQLLPPFEAYRGKPPEHAFAPLLNLRPREFLLGLAEQYLLAVLQAVLYESLLAENERRMRHLDAAVRHLGERSGEILRRVRALRQEEIIEEIEVILLSAAQLDDGAEKPSPWGP